MQPTRHTLLSTLAVIGLAIVGGLALGASAAPAEARGLAATGAVFTTTNSADGNAVLAFRRSARGGLTFLDAYDTGGTGTGAGLGNQGGLVLDTSGNHLFAVNAGGDGNISGLRLAADGTLTLIAGSTRPLSGSGTAPAQISFSPDGQALVVTEKGTNSLVTYVVGDDGLASDPIVTASEGDTPFGFAFGHRARLFVSEAFGGAFEASAVSSYDLRRDGSLEPITPSLPTTETAACWLVVTGNGRYAYTTNTGSDSITGLALARNGVVSLLDVDGFTAQAGDAPIDAAFSRNSRFLYVLNSGDGSLSAYSVRADGGLEDFAGVDGLPAGANGLAAK